MRAVRPAQKADAPAIAAIYASAVRAGGSTLDTEVLDAAYFAAQIGDPVYVMCVAELNGAVVGWSRIRPWSPKRGYRTTGETSVFIDTAHHRQGFGRLLTAALTAAAPAAGYRNLVARIWADNGPSLTLFGALGYRTVGVQTQVGWDGAKWVDVAILERIVDETPPPG